MGVPGGYIDPDGKLRGPDPSMLLTRTAGVRPDFDAKCPRFDKLVRSLANYDKDVEEQLWQLIGYTLCGLGTEQKFPFLHGAKGNEGKTTFFTILGRVFGGYGRTFDPKIFTKTRNENQFAWGPFNGAWFIYGSEITKGAEWNTTGLKTATGGGKVTAEKKYLDSFEMQIRFMPWFSANDLPHFRGLDEALKRRMMLFKCSTPLLEIIPGYDDAVFDEEGPAILGKGVRYRQAYLDANKRIEPCSTVQGWVDAYFDEGDIVGLFVEDMLSPNPEGKALKQEVYNSFHGYALNDQGREHVFAKPEFFRQLEVNPKFLAMGGMCTRARFGDRHTSAQQAVVGVSLKTHTGFPPIEGGTLSTH
jgi:putative DNA primase/helicase